MPYQKYIKPAIIIISIILAFALGLGAYRYFIKQDVVSSRLIDPQGKELKLGYLSTTDDQSFAKVVSQIKSTGKDPNGYYIEAMFETSEGIKTPRISIGGDTAEAYVLIFKQDSNLFFPQGQIRYEKFSREDSIKNLKGNNKSVALILPLKSGELTKAGYSQSFLDNGIDCNKKFLENLKQDKIQISCRPLVLQMNIQK